MANVKISELTSKAVPASADEIVLVDSVGGASKKTTVGALPSGDNNRTLDAVPTDGNTANSVSSDGVFDALAGKSDTSHNHDSAYATAAQGTTADNALPKSGGTMTGALEVDSYVRVDSGAVDEVLRVEGTGSPYMSWYDTGVRQAYIGSFGNTFAVVADTPDTTIKASVGGSYRLEIDSTGIDVTGSVTADDVYITGTSPNLFFTDTDGNHIAQLQQSDNDFYIDNDSTGDINLRVDSNTTVLKVKSTGIDVTGDLAVSGTVDGVDIATRDGVLTSTTNTADAALPKAGGTMTGALDFGDDVKANFGADDDLQIYHDGSNSYIDDVGAGDLLIRASDQIALSNADNSEYYAIFDENGACGFRYNNSTKLATTSTGIDVTGDTTTDSLTVQGAITEKETPKTASFTPNLSTDGTIFDVSGTLTITMPTATAGKSFTIIDSGSGTLSWSGTIKWSGGTLPTANDICIYTFISNGDDWYGMQAGSGFATV